MATSDHDNENINIKILAKIDNLEKRIARIENNLFVNIPDIEDSDNKFDNNVGGSNIPENKDSLVESRIGEYGLAWLGNIVLLFGIIFTTQYLNSLGFIIMPSVVGIVTAIGVLFASKYTKTNYQNLAELFNLTAYLLLYYFIMRLHFYNSTPIITNKIWVILMLLTINGYLYFIYYSTSKNLVGSLALILIVLTSLLSDIPLLCFPIFVCVALMSMYFFKIKRSYRQLLLSQIVIYGAMLIWIFGNPVAGNSLHLVSSSKYVLLFLFVIAGIFSSIALLPNSDNELKSESITGMVFFNGFLFTILLTIYVVSLFEAHFIWIFLALFAGCLSFAALLKIKTEWKIIPALYALYGFLAFSVAVYSYYKFPWAIFLLAIESLLVVSVSLWFRTRIIIVLNLILFVVLLLINLFDSHSINQINFIFPIIAIISARIINWQKLRLDIKTEFIRNTYLIIAFFMFLYAFYKALPSQFITMAWIITAVVYFLVSILLKNIKYRYMAIGTFVSTVIYLFFTDLSKIDLIYRVLTFMALSLILIIVSIYYSRKRKASSDN